MCAVLHPSSDELFLLKAGATLYDSEAVYFLMAIFPVVTDPPVKLLKNVTKCISGCHFVSMK